MKHYAAILTLVLAACSRTAPPETSPKPDAKPAAAAAVAAAPAPPEPGSAPPQPPELPQEQKDALMRAIFGDAYDAKEQMARVPEEGGGEDGTIYRTRMTFEAANALPDGRTAVIVNSVSMADGEKFASHGTSGTLNVYLLRHRDAAWEVLDRYEEVDQIGAYGNLGAVKWLPLGDGRQGFMISSFDTGQGYSIETASIFALNDGVHDLGEFKLASDNSGACDPEHNECWDVDGTVRIADGAVAGAYRDLLVDFTGKHYTVAEDRNGKEVERITARIRQTARYRFDGKEYVLAAGTNPVPDV